MKVSEMTFPQLLTAMKRPPYKGTLICFDPGETTGLAVFVDGEPVHKDQLLTKDLTASAETVSGVFSRWKGWQMVSGNRITGGRRDGGDGGLPHLWLEDRAAYLGGIAYAEVHWGDHSHVLGL